jgi:hypothetical protein
MSEARYRVKAVKFRCGDESGLDFLGSDEPFWVFTALDANNKVHTTRSKVFGDVDSGNSRRFESDGNRNVVWPHKGDAAGARGPIALTIQLWESDQGDPDEVAKNTELAFELGGQIPGHGEWIKRVPKIVRDQLADLKGLGCRVEGRRLSWIWAARRVRIRACQPSSPRCGTTRTRTARGPPASGG